MKAFVTELWPDDLSGLYTISEYVHQVTQNCNCQSAVKTRTKFVGQDLCLQVEIR